MEFYDPSLFPLVLRAVSLMRPLSTTRSDLGSVIKRSKEERPVVSRMLQINKQIYAAATP